MFTVSDIKQFCYCPRIIYFTYVMPVKKKPTFKMEYGKEEHLRTEELEERRKLKIYGFADGQRQFRVYLKSERLNLCGVLDMLISSNGYYYPVDFKDSLHPPGTNHRYQLTAYALLVEEMFNKPVRQGFIYSIPLKKVYSIPITQNMRDYTKKILARVKRIIELETMPRLSSNSVRWARCRGCEFRNWCGDVFPDT